MPRQNRVTPRGEIVAVPERGRFLGNRGCLHDAHGRIRRRWQLTRWIVCVLEFKGRKRAVMTPGHYTELFFLDEATAFAAGHRPCAECRRERFDAFRRAVAGAAPLPSAVELDRQLHAQRVLPDRSQRTHRASLDELPDGAFVLLPGAERMPHLVLGEALLSWTAGGYGDRVARPRGLEVDVLTPELTVRAIRGGYEPDLHPTARGSVLPLYRDPHFTFRFADDRRVPRFHLDGVEPGTPVSVFALGPAPGEVSELLATAVAGADGWVELTPPLIVRAGGGFAAVPGE